MIDYETCANLPTAFFRQAERLADKPFLWAKREGAYRPLTWRQVAEAVRDLARGLRAIGVAPGDRVVLVSENRPEWLIADYAVMAVGAITVPAYTTNTTSDHRHVLTDSEAKLAIVSTRALAEPLLPAALHAPSCRHLVSLEPLEVAQSGAQLEMLSWDALLARGRALQDDVEARAAQAGRDEVCCFIYTSGTGGTPKGVMLTHANILCNCLGAYDLLEEFGLGDEVFLSFLPLSHSYEHTAGQHFPVTIGAQIYYAEGVETLLANLAEARPTIMTAVPRLYEMMHLRILRGLNKQSAGRQRLFHLAERLGRKRYHDPKSLGPYERLLDGLAELLVRRKVRARFGGRLKAMVSGGAALNPDIGIFFLALGVRLLQGYGQTEASPVVSANRPRRIKMHTVGPPLKGVEVRIADDGEILVRGELVMKGYWKRPQATAEALRDGWLHTGDIGAIDADGFISVTDRKKDIVVLSGGDNVSPARIESFLTLQPEINQAMVIGDRRPHLVCLLVPDREWLADWARHNGRPPDLAALYRDEALRQALGAVVERVNRELSSIERVRRFLIAAEPFSVDNGMMTPTMKIRRHVIKQVYGPDLEALYAKTVS